MTERCFRALDAELATHDYLVGDAFSAADVMFGYTLYICNMLGLLKQEETPYLHAYLE